MVGQKVNKTQAIAVLVSAILLSALTVHVQYSSVGLSYLEDGTQIRRHLRVLQGTAPDPWQYRVLPEYLVELIIRGLEALAVPHPVAAGFLGFRVAQNILLFLAANLYYRGLGLQIGPTLLGLSMLAWGMTNALYDSDLQFSTYFDVAAYLLAGWVIARNKPIWIIPITGLAALNRETSGLIPFILVAAQLSSRAEKGGVRKVLVVAATSLAIYAAVFVGLRLLFGWRPPALPYNRPRGLPVIKLNLRRPVTYLQMLAALGIIPFMALIFYRRWPYLLKAFFWMLVPLWFAIHLCVGVMAETRLFLVPQALVFIPAALLGVISANGRASRVAPEDVSAPTHG